MTRRRKKRKDPNDFDLDFSKLEECSHSELVAIAQKLGITNATRQLPRDDLIEVICGAEYTIYDPVAEIRELTHEFVQTKSVMVSHMPCDLNCPVCPHNKVVECWSRNETRIYDAQT